MTSFVSIKETLMLPDSLRTDTSKLPALKMSDLPKNTFMRTLGQAVMLKRPHGSATEAGFVAWLCNRLPVSMIDGSGNMHVDMRTEPAHRTMFTAHTDTVHHVGGSNIVRIDGRFWRADKGSALGADDGAGVALLCHMIEANVPGYYVFFRGEECGGIGSRWLAEEMSELFDNIDRAVAFDRGGYCDVITHQSGGRCCSNEFGQALASALTTELDWYLPSDHGVYTDTAEFVNLVPECTNISVGYKNQHGDREELDVEFVQRLAQQVLKVQWDELPVMRNTQLVTSPSYFGCFGSKDFILGADETKVMDAIENALSGSYTELIDMIARTVYPSQPGLAYKHINHKHLDDETLEYALDMIDSGWSAPEILNDLYEMSTTV